MSGIVAGVDYSLLFSGGSSSGDVSSGILSVLYGGAASAGSGTAVSSGNPILDLQLAERNQTKDVAAEAKDPTVQRDLANYNKAVAAAPSIQSALQNPAVLQVLLTANGLGDQVQYPALASKILLSDPNDPKSLVNQISDTRWKSVVQALALNTKGLAGLTNTTANSQLASSYERVAWLNSLDAATPGLAQALQFKQQASSITNVDQILGDPTNWEVVLNALGIPQQIAYQELPAQEQAVSSRLNISKLQDPNFVNSLTDQYLLAKQASSQGSSSYSSAATVLSLYA